YSLEIVPAFWLLTKKTQSRIFQQMTVPDILKQVLTGLDVAYELPGTWEQRDYCVQYRETDFNFASRLMEEEGIYYFHRHTAGKHTLVLANTPQSHDLVPGTSRIIYKNMDEQGPSDQDYISELCKVQEQVSGKVLLWDHTFEQPHQNLAAEKLIQDNVMLGKVSHNLKAGNATKLELYDWPGEYAQRFDGINKGGGEQPAEIQKIFTDNKRTVDIRMQAEAAGSVFIRGNGSARNMICGHKFTLATQPTDLVTTPIKAEGDYVLYSVTHSASLPASYRSGESGRGSGFLYDNSFQAIPAGLPYRPTRITPRPIVAGTQSAVVVGPAGEEIFTDKYGRIKVQFHWDRKGQRGPDSSCWIRVGTVWAGRHWGGLHIPRIGQEVIVDFLEGDPDQPIVVASVYNPDQMPMYTLPNEKTKSYIRTNSSLGGDGYHEIRFEDKAGKEQIYIHSQRNMDVRVRNDNMERIGNNRHLRVGFYLANDHKGDVSGETKKGSQFEEIAVDQHLKVHRNSDEHIGGNMKLLVGGIDGKGDQDIHIKHKKHELIDDTSDLHVKKAVTELFDETHDVHIKGAVKHLFDSTLDEHVKGNVTQKYDGGHDYQIASSSKGKIGGNLNSSIGGAMTSKIGSNMHLTVGSNHEEKVGMKMAVDAGQEIHLKAGMNVVLEAMNITLKGAGGFITVGPAGVAIQGVMVLINSGGAAVPGSGASPGSPANPGTATDAKDAKDAKDAAPTKPTDADYSRTGEKSN
ncbi:MAG: type VI secretion system Vgr family protein, partial [Gemmataceae bacterium]